MEVPRDTIVATGVTPILSSRSLLPSCIVNGRRAVYPISDSQHPDPRYPGLFEDVQVWTASSNFKFQDALSEEVCARLSVWLSSPRSLSVKR